VEINFFDAMVVLQYCLRHSENKTKGRIRGRFYAPL
jgi:hypothetical protein